MKFRPTAIPLITVDPYFSIWSFLDNLYDDVTRHWTGQRNAMLGLIKIDGKTYRFMGKISSSNVKYIAETDVISQKSVEVNPLTTTYIFENEVATLTVNFLTPLLIKELNILSRPVSYIYYNIEFKDNKNHKTELYVEISSEVCVDNLDQNVIFTQSINNVSCGNKIQNILNKSGDDTRIDWGYLHLFHENAFVSTLNSRLEFIENEDITKVDITEDKIANDNNGLACISTKTSDMFCFAYDDIKSIEYFGNQLDPYYKLEYGTFENMISIAISDFDNVRQKSMEFQNELTSLTNKISPEYADGCAIIPL